MAVVIRDCSQAASPLLVFNVCPLEGKVADCPHVSSSSIIIHAEGTAGWTETKGDCGILQLCCMVDSSENIELQLMSQRFM